MGETISMGETAKNFLAFDYGRKRIGIAVGQTTTQTAQPLQPLQAIDGVPRWQQLDDLVKEWQPDGFVIGMPYHMDDRDEGMTDEVRIFINRVEERYGLPVYTADERLTSREARKILLDRGGEKALAKYSIDCVAAQLILETWLRSG